MVMKTYHCINPEENPFPYWMKDQEKEPKISDEDLVEEFKKNPNSFFPSFNPPTKPHKK